MPPSASIVIFLRQGTGLLCFKGFRRHRFLHNLEVDSSAECCTKVDTAHCVWPARFRHLESLSLCSSSKPFFKYCSYSCLSLGSFGDPYISVDLYLPSANFFFVHSS